MITITIHQEVKKGKAVTESRSIEKFKDLIKARKRINPIVKEMKLAEKEKRTPSIYISAVSFDTSAEKELIKSTGCITFTENE